MRRRVAMNWMGKIRAIVAVTAVILAAPVLSACQFQPLYGTSQNGQNMAAVMKTVEIPTIPGRVGQVVRNELIFGTTGGGHPAEPNYRLEVVLRESVSSILVEQTGDAQGKQYNLDAAFQLVRLKDGKVVMKGNSTSRASFDKFEPIYSNVRAERDAENRAARVVSDNIKTRVASYLSSSV